MPALFTRMVIDPREASVSVTRPATSAERVTSATAEKTRTPVLPIASAVFASAARSRPQMATEAPSEARRCAMARPMPRLAPVTRATPPERGFCRGDSAFVVFIPAIRILPPPGHSFCAKLILSSGFFAALGTPEAAKGIGGIPPPAQKTIFRSTRQCSITACGCRAAFPIIPTFSETMRFPVEAFPGAPEEDKPRYRVGARRNGNEWNTKSDGARNGCGALPDSWERACVIRAGARGRAGCHRSEVHHGGVQRLSGVRCRESARRAAQVPG